MTTNLGERQTSPKFTASNAENGSIWWRHHGDRIISVLHQLWHVVWQNSAITVQLLICNDLLQLPCDSGYGWKCIFNRKNFQFWNINENLMIMIMYALCSIYLTFATGPPVTSGSPHRWLVMRKEFSCHDVLCRRGQCSRIRSFRSCVWLCSFFLLFQTNIGSKLWVYLWPSHYNRHF